jgi:hypothetical protein
MNEDHFNAALIVWTAISIMASLYFAFTTKL